MEASLNSVIARHEVLRSSFEKTAGVWSQRIAAKATISVSRVDLSGTPTTAQREQADRIAAEEVHKRFDLGKAPLLRATLITLAPEHWTLLLNLAIAGPLVIACIPRNVNWTIDGAERQTHRKADTVPAILPFVHHHSYQLALGFAEEAREISFASPSERS